MRRSEKKAASDVAAYARSLAEARHRNVRLAEEAVTQSRAFTHGEALAAAPPLIDLVATSVDDLVGSSMGGGCRASMDARSPCRRGAHGSSAWP